jgi:hypothetical protein
MMTVAPFMLNFMWWCGFQGISLGNWIGRLCNGGVEWHGFSNKNLYKKLRMYTLYLKKIEWGHRTHLTVI